MKLREGKPKDKTEGHPGMPVYNQFYSEQRNQYESYNQLGAEFRPKPADYPGVNGAQVPQHGVAQNSYDLHEDLFVISRNSKSKAKDEFDYHYQYDHANTVPDKKKGSKRGRKRKSKVLEEF